MSLRLLVLVDSQRFQPILLLFPAKQTTVWRKENHHVYSNGYTIRFPVLTALELMVLYDTIYPASLLCGDSSLSHVGLRSSGNIQSIPSPFTPFSWSFLGRFYGFLQALHIRCYTYSFSDNEVARQIWSDYIQAPLLLQMLMILRD